MRPIWSKETEKVTQQCIPSIFEKITIFTKNFEKRMYSPGDVTYISIETVNFRKNQNIMATRNWRKKKTGDQTLMLNESLETYVYIASVRRRLQKQNGICMDRRIKRWQIREKHLHSNKCIRTASRTADVMSGFLNIKTKRQLVRNNWIQRLGYGNK